MKLCAWVHIGLLTFGFSIILKLCALVHISILVC